MSSNAEGGFALLPEIRTQKPRLPDDSNLEDLDSVKLFPETKPVSKACRGVSIAISPDFQDLIDRLVEQHVKEISGKEQLCERNGHRPSHERPDGTHGRCKVGSFAFSASSGTDSMHSVATSQSRQSQCESKQRQSRTSVTSLLREKHKEMREIHASDILDAWNDSITTTMFRDPYLAKLQKSRTNLSQDSEIPLEEYEKMSRLQKLQAWFESPNYESLILTCKSRHQRHKSEPMESAQGFQGGYRWFETCDIL